MKSNLAGFELCVHLRVKKVERWLPDDGNVQVVFNGGTSDQNVAMLIHDPNLIIFPTKNSNIL